LTPGHRCQCSPQRPCHPVGMFSLEGTSCGRVPQRPQRELRDGWLRGQAVSSWDYALRCGCSQQPPGMPNGGACASGEGCDQDGDCLRRQRPAAKPDHDERSGSSESGRYDAVGEVFGARRAQERHRWQVRGRSSAPMRTCIAVAGHGRDLKKKQVGSGRMMLVVQRPRSFVNRSACSGCNQRTVRSASWRTRRGAARRRWRSCRGRRHPRSRPDRSRPRRPR
jgi:hypothetical protein